MLLFTNNIFGSNFEAFVSYYQKKKSDSPGKWISYGIDSAITSLKNQYTRTNKSPSAIIFYASTDSCSASNLPCLQSTAPKHAEIIGNAVRNAFGNIPVFGHGAQSQHFIFTREQWTNGISLVGFSGTGLRIESNEWAGIMTSDTAAKRIGADLGKAIAVNRNTLKGLLIFTTNPWSYHNSIAAGMNTTCPLKGIPLMGMAGISGGNGYFNYIYNGDHALDNGDASSKGQGVMIVKFYGDYGIHSYCEPARWSLNDSTTYHNYFSTATQNHLKRLTNYQPLSLYMCFDHTHYTTTRSNSIAYHIASQLPSTTPFFGGHSGGSLGVDSLGNPTYSPSSAFTSNGYITGMAFYNISSTHMNYSYRNLQKNIKQITNYYELSGKKVIPKKNVPSLKAFISIKKICPNQ